MAMESKLERKEGPSLVVVGGGGEGEEVEALCSFGEFDGASD